MITLDFISNLFKHYLTYSMLCKQAASLEVINHIGKLAEEEMIKDYFIDSVQGSL